MKNIIHIEKGMKKKKGYSKGGKKANLIKEVKHMLLDDQEHTETLETLETPETPETPVIPVIPETLETLETLETVRDDILLNRMVQQLKHDNLRLSFNARLELVRRILEYPNDDVMSKINQFAEINNQELQDQIHLLKEVQLVKEEMKKFRQVIMELRTEINQADYLFMELGKSFKTNIDDILFSSKSPTLMNDILETTSHLNNKLYTLMKGMSIINQEISDLTGFSQIAD